uniref:Putative ovule protein n=1 Tax=Solanum chacoense TaxID=4108 RepID=A0A0V0GXG4_SOLCH
MLLVRENGNNLNCIGSFEIAFCLDNVQIWVTFFHINLRIFVLKLAKTGLCLQSIETSMVSWRKLWPQ